MATSRLASFFLLAVTAVLVSSGCSGSKMPQLAEVHGLVTLDGAPYPNAHLTFTPAKGRPSEAVTNGEGKFELTYMPQVKGAELGDHTIIITTQPPAPADPNKEVNFIEPLPPKYNVQSTLKITVEKGNNEINLPLTSK